MKIKLIPITNQQKLYEAFGFTDEQAKALKQEIVVIWRETDTWTELIERIIKEHDDGLTTAFKLFTVGELLGTIKQLEGDKA